MFRSYKYRLNPTKEQQQKIDHSINVCRLIYNLALQTKIWAWQAGIKLTAFDLCFQLIDLKKEYDWINQVDSQALQNAVKKVDKSFKNFFEGKGYPKFKSKHKSKQSFESSIGRNRIDWNNSILTIPKIYDIPIILSRQFEGKMRTVTIVKTKTKKYFVSVVIKDEQDIISKPKVLSISKVIGLDVGIKNFVISSDGRKFEPNRKLKENLKRLKIIQRRSDRKQKGSKNQRKANFKVALLHERIKNQRADYIHKVTYALTHDNQVESIVIEDLNIVGMLKNRKLSQSITDVAWGALFWQLEYKCLFNGKNFIRINRFEPTSKLCSNCKELNEFLVLKERKWTCEFCDTTHDRDLNAAKNIRLAGIKKYISTNSGRDTSGEPVERSAMKGRKEAGKNYQHEKFRLSIS